MCSALIKRSGCGGQSTRTIIFVVWQVSGKVIRLLSLTFKRKTFNCPLDRDD